jgi:hypothetical protein
MWIVVANVNGPSSDGTQPNKAFDGHVPRGEVIK